MKVELFPGTVGLAGLCVSLLGAERVDTGSWTEPVAVLDATQDEINAIIELAAEQGVTVYQRNV